jgi:hypothetical protein
MHYFIIFYFFAFFFYLIFLIFFFKKNINNIFKLYIINRKLKLRFIYYFISGNPSNDGRSDKPRSRSPYAQKAKTRTLNFLKTLSTI